MKSHFHNLSIRYKLTLIAMLTCTVALLLACAGFAVYDYVSVRTDMSNRLLTQARMIGGNSTAAIAFDNAADATSTLATLSAEPGIRAGCVYSTDGHRLAAYTTRDFRSFPFLDRPRADRIWFTGDSLELFQHVELDGKAIGTVYLYSDLEALHARMKRYALIGGGLTLLAAAVAFLLVSRLQRYISAPILELADVARRVSEKKDYTLRAPRYGRDEVGVLIDCFNTMIDALEQSYKTVEQQVLDRTHELQEAQMKLVETARAAGMAEVATSVLHNVGNVLNSVNVSTGLVSDKIRQSPVKNLARAVGLMQERTGDLAQFISTDERGRQIPGYLVTVTGVLMQEQKALIEELGSLARNVEHIKQIVQVQQSFAKSAGIIESVDLKALIEDALRVNIGSLERHKITIHQEIPDLPPISTDKHSVLQILINLVSNAKHAVLGITDHDRRITVRAVRAICDGQPQIVVDVEDNGSGIQRENVNRIFSHGFTTKKDGHGFGLHSAANAAKQLGGSLQAYSAGPGKGARFTLSIPYSSEKVIP